MHLECITCVCMYNVIYCACDTMCVLVVVEHAALMGFAMAAITSNTPAMFSFYTTSSELLSLVENSSTLDHQLLVCILCLHLQF